MMAGALWSKELLTEKRKRNQLNLAINPPLDMFLSDDNDNQHLFLYWQTLSIGQVAPKGACTLHANISMACYGSHWLDLV